MKKLQACTDMHLDSMFTEAVERAAAYLKVANMIQAERDRRNCGPQPQDRQVVAGPWVPR
jgi:hypothetical protein